MSNAELRSSKTSLGRPVTIGTPMVLSVFDDWYSQKQSKDSQNSKKSLLVYQSSHVYQDCTNSVPIVKNSQKQSKDSQTAKKYHWCTNRHMSTQSPPNTQSRANAATLRNLHHMWLGRVDCMCLHGRSLPRAATLSQTLLPTDDRYLQLV